MNESSIGTATLDFIAADTIISVKNLKDIEQNIIASMLTSKELYNKAIASLDYNDFVFAEHSEIFATIKNTEYEKVAILLLENQGKYILTELLYDQNPSLNTAVIYAAISSDASDDIDLDIIELLHYSKIKQEAYFQFKTSKPMLGISFNVENKYGDFTAVYLHGRLCEVYSTNPNGFPSEICDTAQLTMQKLLPLMQDTQSNVTNFKPYDIEPLGQMKFEITVDIKSIQTIDRLIQWADVNQIDEKIFPRSKEMLSNQMIFKLNGMGLKELPSELFYLALVYLDARDNRLTYVDEAIAQQNMMTGLILCNNLIAYIPESILKLKKLLNLCVHGNLLASIPEEIGSLTSLETLSISNNPIEELPASISKLINLKQFDMENTSINEIPIALLQLPKIEQISFDDRHMEFFAQNIHHLCNVDSINIAHSDYSKDDDAIKSFGLKIVREDWMEPEDYQGHGCVILSKSKIGE